MLFWCASIWAEVEVVPDRERGQGPYDRLILRGVNLVTGEGAPAIGPMDVVIEGNRITSIESVGYPGVPIEDDDRPQAEAGDADAITKYNQAADALKNAFQLFNQSSEEHQFNKLDVDTPPDATGIGAEDPLATDVEQATVAPPQSTELLPKPPPIPPPLLTTPQPATPQPPLT